MSSLKLVLHLMMGLLSVSWSSDALEYRSGRAVPATTIYVDKSGSGNYSSVQGAINSVRDNNNQWIRILIKHGTYKEKVKIPSAKQYIFLQGDGQESTTIEYGDAGNAIEAATLQLYADNFVASDITFKSMSESGSCEIYVQNTYTVEIPSLNGTRVTWAPAAVITGDKVSFHRCGFDGIQDTIGDLQGRHYFERCLIAGAIDFIWGRGQSVYKKCTLKTVASTIGQDGYITAQGRQGPNDSSAFVFILGWVIGEGHTYLGRAYRQYSRVVFYNTSMAAVVKPEGWSSWKFQGHEGDITYAEVGCTGEGANKSGRVKWMKSLSTQEVKYFTSKNFMDQDDWMKRQP